ncbi:MAG: DNA methyltransferase [Chloroflexi bacterium]|nr:DNA methyltransferase [Chloroflexota bacterium]
MAKIEDLIKNIPDPQLRNELAREVAKLKAGKKFGLVFEEHIPEQVQIPGLPVKPGLRVVKRGGKNNEVFKVLSSAADGEFTLAREPDGAQETASTADLVVLKKFGETIYPTLTPIDRVTRAPGKPYHTLINADNFHALQLLEYTHTGQVDVIYIDPPYNTGARDWKYNNDYVDSNDQWRHSKWLSMMKKRLLLGKKLLKSDTGVLIVTIDEKEVYHLGMLLEQVFPEARIQMVSTMINPANVARAGAFGRSDEYIFYVMLGNIAPQRLRLGREWVSDKGRTHTGNIRWDLLRRSGTNAARSHSPGCFYPIYVNPDNMRIESIGSPLPNGQSIPQPIKGLIPVLPIRRDRSEGNWQWAPKTIKERMVEGRVRVGGSQERGYVIYILKDGEFAKIQRGEFNISGYGNNDSIEVEQTETSFVLAIPGSQWRIASHDATQYGSRLLGDILPDKRFPFPKSVYATRDAIRFFVEDKPNAIIIDFFAGSGTTLNAVNLLNAADGGNRCCILVTNNEVSDDEAKNLTDQGYKPGDDGWERHGICNSVTWPRSKFTIRGIRDDGTELNGEYFTDKVITKEKPRRFKHIGFLSTEQITTTANKKQLLSLFKDFPQSLVMDDSAFIVSSDHSVSILFDEAQADTWLDALEEQNHITDFYIVATSKATFDTIKARVTKLLGSLTETEAEKRPMSTGFDENLEYFRLDFLDPDEIVYGEKFDAILPILWLMAGARGEREAAGGPSRWFISATSPFAVLLDETAFAEFKREIKNRTDITHVFLVTDSERAYREMLADLPKIPHTRMLYKNYLDNFRINTENNL